MNKADTVRTVEQERDELLALVKMIDEAARFKSQSEGREPPRYTLNRIGEWTRKYLNREKQEAKMAALRGSEAA